MGGNAEQRPELVNMYYFTRGQLAANPVKQFQGKEQPLFISQVIGYVLVVNELNPVNTALFDLCHFIAFNPFVTPRVCRQHPHLVSATNQRARELIGNTRGPAILESGVKVRNHKANAHFESISLPNRGNPRLISPNYPAPRAFCFTINGLQWTL